MQIFILISCLFMFFSLHAVVAEEEFQLEFEYEIAFFIANRDLFVWDATKMEISHYKGKQPVKSLKVSKGQGPKDFQVITEIFSDGRNYMIWDRFARRLSYFSRDWEFRKIAKFHRFPFASPLGKFGNQFIFQWSKFSKGKKGRKITQYIGTFQPDDSNSFHSVTGYFQKDKILNYDRPHLVASMTGDTIYYAINNDYTIYSIDLSKKKYTTHTFTRHDWKPVKWQNKAEELQWEIQKKPVRPARVSYPDHIPPIFSLSASGDLLAVITNRKILEKKTGIDFYKEGRFIGKIEIPIIYMQHFVFPSFLYFKSGIEIVEDSLYSLHYNDKEEVYKIIKWKLNF